MHPTATVDLHVHTRLSHDGIGTVLQCCEVAVSKGLRVVGFTEHMDFDPLDPGLGHFEYSRVVGEIEEARSRYAGRLRVLLGVEIDYQDWFEDQIAAFLAAHRFDYTIGSVHALGQQTLMGAEYVAHRDVDMAYRDYFRAAARCAGCGLFDVLGHLEYAVLRGRTAYGPYAPERYEKEIDEVLHAVLDGGVALEVNGAGLRHGVGQTYPGSHVLRRYGRLGGSCICIGSDAHCPSEIGCGIWEAQCAARDAGIEGVWLPTGA